jgi:hypothetical protein
LRRLPLHPNWQVKQGAHTCTHDAQQQGKNTGQARARMSSFAVAAGALSVLLAA